MQTFVSADSHHKVETQQKHYCRHSNNINKLATIRNTKKNKLHTIQ